MDANNTQQFFKKGHVMSLLKIKDVKSYSKNTSVDLDLSKKINLIYGQNGSGKSTISGYFYKPQDSTYKNCSYSDEDRYRYIVYNSEFVEDSFYHKREQPGIFTLSQGNKDVLELIKESEKKIVTSKSKITRLEASCQDKDDMRDKLINTCKDSVWSKSSHVRRTDLSELMSGSLKRETFYQKITSQSEKEDINTDDLLKEYRGLKDNQGVSYSLISLPQPPSLTDEQHELLLTSLVPSTDSYLSKLIQQLSNADWVKAGLSYTQGEQCPFCQKNTIDEDFINSIKSIFDETYEKTLTSLKELRDEYISSCNEYNEKIIPSIANSNYVSEFDDVWYVINQVKSTLEANVRLIQDKIEKPSSSISIIDVVKNSEMISKSINGYNEEMKVINDKVGSYEDSIQDIKNKTWSALRNICDDIIVNQDKNLSELAKEKQSLIDNMKNIKKELQDENEKIVTYRKQVSNMDETVDKINSSLSNLGLVNLKIKKAKESNFFQIHRGDDNVEVYKTLSEGEKTIITFLYFLECCGGQLDGDEDNSKEKIIVIDDPISSLSHDYIYEISSLIQYRIIKGLPADSKVLILTHNLFFFQEMLKLAPSKDSEFEKKYKLFRVVKNEYSNVIPMRKDDIKNEYESFWMVLKNIKDGIVNPVVLPNVMRNILEYYFSFSCKTEKLNEALGQLANSEIDINYKSFCRYMHRGSHSDSSNINNLGRASSDKYFEIFKEIFVKTDNLSHYNKMLGVKAEELSE
ncbi:AAA family ATPase [Photorhabdus bodei]|uniref:AAA family ATPase n=1 Tax=Photorhabdus bodei TaxID=2029681 RepID=A0AAW6BIT0_9GAMM|nr:AAA family ATPase [Photorhabdus bodei]MCC8466724.1 AAA family ATPase [Photorhabdus bodei]MDB6372618.1 AAA family ATPase [Photorhabdus bodei]